MITLAQTVDINLWAVLGAAAAMFAVGAVWYSPVLFGKEWQKMIVASGKLKASDMKKMAPEALIGSFLCYLLMAYALAYINALLGVDGWIDGITVAAWIALGFVVTISLSNALYDGTRKKLWSINTGYTLIGILLMGVILGVWH